MTFEKSSDQGKQQSTIVKATVEDVPLLANIGSVSFIESHGSSAAVEEINKYIHERFNYDVLKEDIDNPKSIFHLINYNNQPAGYSKIILNYPHSSILVNNITKLERLYLLEEFYDLRLGFELLQFNIELSRQSGQLGMWLFVWQKNHRAINFYKKNGFIIIGDYNFQLTASYSNPNYHLFLEY